MKNGLESYKKFLLQLFSKKHTAEEKNEIFARISSIQVALGWLEIQQNIYQ